MIEEKERLRFSLRIVPCSVKIYPLLQTVKSLCGQLTSSPSSPPCPADKVRLALAFHVHEATSEGKVNYPDVITPEVPLSSTAEEEDGTSSFSFDRQQYILPVGDPR